MGKGGLGLTWSNSAGNLWQVQLPANTQPFEYLFYNGARRLRSRVLSSNGTGYYMRDRACYSTVTNKAVSTSECNLGTYLRIVEMVSPDTPDGAGCPTGANQANGRLKCLDRFYYDPKRSRRRMAESNPISTPWHKCDLPATSYPQGDIELTIFNSWSIDMMRVSCVDTARHVVYFTGRTFYVNGGDSFHAFGPMPHHRYIVENTRDAFGAAQAAGQTGLWFLDRATSPWTLNYLAKRGENPNRDSVVIAQVHPVRQTGGSLIVATDLRHVIFSGITLEVDNYVPGPSGFNNDQNTEYTLPRHWIAKAARMSPSKASPCAILPAPASSSRPPPESQANRRKTISSRTRRSSTWATVEFASAAALPGGISTRVSRSRLRFRTTSFLVIRVFFRMERASLWRAAMTCSFCTTTSATAITRGLAVCFFGCIGGMHDASGSNILSAYNHIWDSMQGITSDGGTLYYNVGDAGGSGTGNRILNNLVHDTTSAEIIDGFPTGYGGRGIYLDNQTAGVLVENNVVYNMSQDVFWMSRGPAPGQPGHTFNNNIIAYGRRALFHGIEWPEGCKEPAASGQHHQQHFLFRPRQFLRIRPHSRLSYSCGFSYDKFLNFQGNLYWRTDGKFASDPKGFHIVTKAPADAHRCPGRPDDLTYLTFAEWQGSQQPVGWGPPGGMNLDKGGTVTVNPGFGNAGKPTDFLLRSNPVPGFDYTKTNDTIRNAGRKKPATMPAAGAAHAADVFVRAGGVLGRPFTLRPYAAGLVPQWSSTTSAG